MAVVGIHLARGSLYHPIYPEVGRSNTRLRREKAAVPS